MDKWYVETGSIQECIMAENMDTAFAQGLKKGIDRAKHDEVEYHLSSLITVSNFGFSNDGHDIDDDETLFFHTTSAILRDIGEVEMADMLDAEDE